MTETSAIPGFQDTFISTIGALTAFASVPVLLGVPSTSPGRTTVYIGQARFQETPSFLGTLQDRDERFDQDVYISVVQEGTDAVTPRDDVYALRDAIAGQLKTDPTMGGTVITALMGDGTLDAAGNSQAREARLKFTIHCHARI